MSSQNSSETVDAAPRIPQRKRGRERVAALLKAGAEVFSEKGYEAATMTEIAARAGASIGSLYQFFPTKELLAKALHEAYLADLSSMLEGVRQEASGQSAAGMADRLFDGLLAFLAERPAFSALAERRDIDKEQKRKTGAAMREQIAGLLASTSQPFPKARREAMAAVVLQLMKVAVSLSSEEDADRRRAVQFELRQMLKGHLNSVQVA
nr:TetR/AcrR family transcriptional regulator [Microvirga flocculans]